MHQKLPCAKHLLANLRHNSSLQFRRGGKLFGFPLTRYQSARFAALVRSIHHRLIYALEQPIEIHECSQHRDVVVCGSIIYRLHHEDGHYSVLELSTLAGFDSSNECKVPLNRIMLFPPLVCSRSMLETLLNRWQSDVRAFVNYFCAYHGMSNLHDQEVHTDLALQEIGDHILPCIKQYIDWKTLRKGIALSMQIDPEVLDLAKRSRLYPHKNSLTIEHYNNVRKHLNQYREVSREAPNLLWLITLLIKQGEEFSEGMVMSQCKYALEHQGLSPRCWRLLCHSHLRSLAFIFNQRDIWKELVQYLRLHQLLDCTRLIPQTVSHLFDHPEWDISDKHIQYRNYQFHPNLMNKYINEFSRRQHAGEAKALVTDEAAVVLTWLNNEKPTFDHVQLKKPWAWFVGKANLWATEHISRNKDSKLCWDAKLMEIEISGHQIVAISNAWELMRLAISERHCIDKYLNNCLQGTSLVFNIRNKIGKSCATLLLEKSEATWYLDDIRAFANKSASNQMKQIGSIVCDAVNAIEALSPPHHLPSPPA